MGRLGLGTLAALALIFLQVFGQSYRALDATTTAFGLPSAVAEMFDWIAGYLGRPVTAFDLVAVGLFVTALWLLAPELWKRARHAVGLERATPPGPSLTLEIVFATPPPFYRERHEYAPDGRWLNHCLHMIAVRNVSGRDIHDIRVKVLSASAHFGQLPFTLPPDGNNDVARLSPNELKFFFFIKQSFSASGEPKSVSILNTEGQTNYLPSKGKCTLLLGAFGRNAHSEATITVLYGDTGHVLFKPHEIGRLPTPMPRGYIKLFIGQEEDDLPAKPTGSPSPPSTATGTPPRSRPG